MVVALVLTYIGCMLYEDDYWPGNWHDDRFQNAVVFAATLGTLIGFYLNSKQK